jgi:anti-sigma-K factor RskA
MEENKERMLELLADQTLFGLTEGETAELENLKNRFVEFKGDDSFEMTATAINLMNLEIDDSLPAHLQAKLEAQAQEFLGAPQNVRQIAGVERNQSANSSKDEIAGNIYEVKSKPPIWQWLGWAVAATACVALAINLWLSRSQLQPEFANEPKTVQTPESVNSPELAQIPESVNTPEPANSPEIVKTPEQDKTPELAKIPKTIITPEIVIVPETAKTPPTVKTPAPELTAAQKREQLLASAPDVIQTNWTAAKGNKQVLGDVVWSNAQQKGYVRMRGMPALDPTKETYQLWIFDDERNEKTPVSGGMFNMSAAGEVIIPITAQLKISKPKQFAVTKEKAGGVVVSKPDRVVAIAKV